MAALAEVSMATEFDLLREEYLALRAEILQSIAKQHQILLGGYGLSGAILGYILSSSQGSKNSVLIVPLVLMTMISLWTAECNRMTRASFYIGYHLWPALRATVNATHNVGWETWIRSDSGNFGGFRIRSRNLQLVVVLLVPFLATVIAIAQITPTIWRSHRMLTICMWLLVLACWSWLGWNNYKVSDIGAIVPEVPADGGTSLRSDPEPQS